MKHQMIYRAGSHGFTHIGIPDGPAHWYCRCGRWSFIARPNITRDTGNNQIEAQAAFSEHVVNTMLDEDE